MIKRAETLKRVEHEGRGGVEEVFGSKGGHCDNCVRHSPVTTQAHEDYW